MAESEGFFALTALRIKAQGLLFWGLQVWITVIIRAAHSLPQGEREPFSLATNAHSMTKVLLCMVIRLIIEFWVLHKSK